MAAIVTPRNASTVILVRDRRSALEVFMMRRHIQSDFVGGAYVFPGGVVDPDDEIDASLCAGRTDSEASAILGLERGGLAFWVAAIRECFEEAGVLLAYGADNSLIDSTDPEKAARYAPYRHELNQGDLTLREFLRREHFRLATDRVHYWAHWITPEGQPRRYDTRFFLALAPARQVAEHDGHELTESAWVTPQAALQKAAAREWVIILPTRRNLRDLCQYETAADAESAARARIQIPAIMPQMIRHESGIRFVVPGEEAREPEDD